MFSSFKIRCLTDFGPCSFPLITDSDVMSVIDINAMNIRLSWRLCRGEKSAGRSALEGTVTIHLSPLLNCPCTRIAPSSLLQPRPIFLFQSTTLVWIESRLEISFKLKSLSAHTWIHSLLRLFGLFLFSFLRYPSFGGIDGFARVHTMKHQHTWRKKDPMSMITSGLVLYLPWISAGENSFSGMMAAKAVARDSTSHSVR